MLIRCCDISSKAASATPGQPALPNPYGEAALMPIQPQVSDILFARNNFVKKLLEDASAIDETPRLLRYCCWENNQFSFTVLSEILWQVGLENEKFSVNSLSIHLMIVNWVFRLHSPTPTSYGLI